MKRSILVFLLCTLASVRSLRAADGEFFPSGHEVFERLIADPRELQYSARLIAPVSKSLSGQAAIGDYVGLYKGMVEGGAVVQISLGGGAFGRFDLSSKTNDMESADFFANIPLDLRKGKWSGRFMMYHTSSHLGDDFIKRTGRTIEKHSWDNLRWLASYQAFDSLRLYSGYTYAFRTLPQSIGRSALQGGFEWVSKWVSGKHVRWYWANDFQSWERTDWRPAFNAQLGFTVKNNPTSMRSVSFYVDFGAGGQPEGQFYLQRETHWGTGVRFQIS